MDVNGSHPAQGICPPYPWGPGCPGRSERLGSVRVDGFRVEVKRGVLSSLGSWADCWAVWPAPELERSSVESRHGGMLIPCAFVMGYSLRVYFGDVPGLCPELNELDVAIIILATLLLPSCYPSSTFAAILGTSTTPRSCCLAASWAICRTFSSVRRSPAENVPSISIFCLMSVKLMATN